MASTQTKRRSVGGWWAMLAVFAVQATLAAAAPVPPVLEPWRDWALHGTASARCTPFGDATRCAWPGELRIDAGADGLTFVHDWSLEAAHAVALPGDSALRPFDVRVDGTSAPVVLREGVPQVILEAGRHRIEGRIAWARRPPTLPLPPDIALLALRVDGVDVAAPQRNDEDALVLGAAGAGESDALQIEIYRLLADGVPQLLATRVELSVSGRPRELALGQWLPAGFAPVALDGDVPARIEPDGQVRVQVRPGHWSLFVLARALAPATEFRLPPTGADAPLPGQEIWQFRADPQFRLAQFVGVPGVDPNQVHVPDWNEIDDQTQRWDALFDDAETLPTFVLDRDAVATLDVKLRGLPDTRPARLNLQRELWLDFDGGGYLAQDTIHGDLGSAQRLDMQAPWTLERAERNGEPLLVTRGAEATRSGVELRDPNVALATGARASRDDALPANGWTQPFDSASAVVHLPPGYRLLGVTGADHASGSWWNAWSLLDLFLLSLFALMAWRLGGVALGGALVAWVLLAWHEPLAPRISLLAAIGLALLLRHLPDGRLARATGWLRSIALVVVAILLLPFAAAQLRMALHPQLEHENPRTGSYGIYDDSDARGGVFLPEVAMQAPPAPAPSELPASKASETLDRLELTGTRIKRVDLLKYPTDTITQAGSARPGWRWHDHTLTWTGPLLTDQSLGLVVSPPWLTRSWRVLAVLLLAFVVWRLALARGVPPLLRAGTGRTPALAGALLFVAAATPLAVSTARAQAAPAAIPPPQLLDALRDRLLARDEACRPECAALGAVTVVAGDRTLTLQLDAQAQADTAWPLPRPDAALQLAGVRIDGADAAAARVQGHDWIALERGVHRVEVVYRADGERWRIAFPLPPATLDVRAEGFEIAGLDEGRLIGDTLDLVPPRRATAASGTADETAGEGVPPFVRVLRNITFDQQWQVVTEIRRIAPLRSGLTVPIALLPGEQLLAVQGDGRLPPVRDGQAIVSLPAGVDTLVWQSRLTPAPELQLVAGDGRAYAEEWQLAVAPLLHGETQGVPEAGQAHPSGMRRFLPLPGETLTVTITRPEATVGASVAIEDVKLAVAPGDHARDTTLGFGLRATRAGPHVIALPPQAELLSFTLDGEAQPLLADAGKLTVPLRTQPQRVELRWREPIDIGMRLRTPEVALGASTANIDLELQVPSDRWLLFTHGPALGPAVLYWSVLAVLLLAAVGLARIGGTPLRLHDWLLLGLGFSALSWIPALIVAGWLLLIGWRARHPEWMARRTPAMLMQLGLGGATAIALLCLLLAVPYGLLGQPDMQVSGNGSYHGTLRWFADRSADGVLPTAGAITLPLWCYKAAILLWSLWLATALMRWLRWTWASLNAGGLWPAKAVAAPAQNDARSADDRFVG